MSAKIFTLYNNKGGVAKTTTLFNIAVMLAQQGKRVLLADCDPQCNTTELFFASSSIVDDPDASLPGTSIFDALKPRFDGDISRVDASQVELPESDRYKGLFLLRGDIEFSLAERYFSSAVTQAITESVHEKNNYAAISRLLDDLAARDGFDVVLCDVGPSAGALTRMVVLACHGIFIPTAPDRFSYQAVKGMGRILEDWFTSHRRIVESFHHYGMDIRSTEPRFYGAIVNNYKVYKVGTKKKVYETWEDRIAEVISGSLIASGPDKSGIQPLRAALKRHPFVASLRDVGPTAPVAQIVGKAIFDVSREDTKIASTNNRAYQGAVWVGWELRMVEYKQEIEKIAQLIGS